MTRPVARRLLAASLAVLGCCVAAPAPTLADDWHSEQPTAAGSPAPTALGRVYDMRFWAPNRGVLLTAGGVWAYDGTDWRQLSTVCGGTGGRIAWAGPLDFWTISDQAVGQANADPVQRQHRSLCHFSGGRIVASYAQPIGTAGEYEPMNAAACLAPDDCWFGGELLPVSSANRGAFHLHWDGTALTAFPSRTTHSATAADPDRPVADLAVHQGSLFESVAIAAAPLDGEPSDQPYRLHQVFDGDPPAVVPLLPSAPIDYGGQPPSSVGPLQLSSDGSQLWAVAGATDPSVAAPVVALRFDGSSFAPLTLNDPGGALAPATQVAAVAAEPGTDDAWVAYVPRGEGGALASVARIARIHADGTVDSATSLPGSGDGLSRKGTADRLACPDAGQCWLATSDGWLFHLGGDLPRDDAPEMHRLITFRPQDAATIILPPDTPADDTSGLAPPTFYEPPPDASDVPTEAPTRTRARKLVTRVRSRVIHRTTLELTFTLTAKAHVQLVARRRRTVVARTRRLTLARGRHKLRLRLSARRWPTKLDFRVTALNAPSRTTAPSGRRDPSRADDDPDAGEVTIEGIRSPVR